MGSLPTLAVAEEGAKSALIKQGEYWQDKGDYNRAAQAWLRVLSLENNSAQALQGLITAYAHSGQLDQANRYLDQFKQAHPSSPLINNLEQTVLLARPQSQRLLQEARDLAKAGQTEAALKKYQELFGGKPPQGALAQEYFNIAGYTETGQAEALRGLRALHKQRPQDDQLALSLAKQLIQQAETRAEGIGLLQELSQKPEVGQEAVQQWRQALTWMGAESPTAIRYFQAYLAKHPDDSQLQEILKKGQALQQERARQARQKTPPPDALTLRARRALKEMDDGNIDHAKAEFIEILEQRSTQPDALGGLGIIMLREGDLSKARSLLQHAQQRDKGWSSSLAQVENQLMLQAADADRDAGNTAEAIKQYQTLLRRDKKNAQAYRGIIQAYLSQNDYDAAQRYLKQFENSLSKNDSDAQIALTQTRAAYYYSTKQLGRAKQELERALIQQPSDPWVRYQLAEVYLNEGRTQDAKNLMQGQLSSPTDKQAVVTTKVLFAAKLDDWGTVKSLLDTVPEHERNSTLRQFSHDLATREQLARVESLCKSGREAEGLNLLSQLFSIGGSDQKWVNQQIEGYTRCGQPQQALQLIDQAAQRQGGRLSTDRVLQRAGLLMSMGQYDSAYRAVQGLDRATLTPKQQQTLDSLSRGQDLRKADLLREQKRYADAYDVLAPWLQAQPDNPDVTAALARLYADTGQTDVALDLYQSLPPDQNLSATSQLEIARLALQSGKSSYGRQIINEVIANNPNNIDLLVDIAALYRQSGYSSDAAKAISKAKQLQKQAAAVPLPDLSQSSTTQSRAAVISSEVPATAVNSNAARRGQANPFR